MRQDAGVEHVGIGEDDAGALADGAPGVLRSVAIVSEGAEVGPHVFDEAVEFLELIFGERLGGEKVQGAGAGAGGEVVEDGKVVAERFAAGGGGDDDDVFTGVKVGVGVGLVGVGPFDAFGGKHLAQFGIEIGRKFAVFGGARGGAADGADGTIGVGRGHAFELLDDRNKVAFAGRE